MQKSKRILVAPLDWGLGHATRCIPMIHSLIGHGHSVVIAASGAPAALLSEEFPELKITPLSNYAIRYAPHPFLLALQFPLMIYRVYCCARREHREIAAIAREEHIDTIISDQRFGCWSPSIRSIYITHQLCVKMPRGFEILERFIARKLRHAAKRFDEVWIPDYPGYNNLTGDLTQKYPLPQHHRFIGPLSRMRDCKPLTPAQHPDLLVLLSGPEPQRSLFEKKILTQLKTFRGTATIARGKPVNHEQQYPSGNLAVQMVAHLPTARLAGLITVSDTVLCRGGYSTIMDLIALGKKAILVPTPGQTEQEYLCKRLARRKRFVLQCQHSLDIAGGIKALHMLPEPNDLPAGNLLEEAVEEGVGL